MANQYLYDLTDTWNNVATTFDAIKINVTDTNSAAGSKLLNLQVGASPKFTVQKDGAVALTGAVTGATSIAMNGALSGATTVGMNGALTGATDVTASGTVTADRMTITKTGLNAPAISSTGYSLTGSNTTAMIDLAGTWATNGAPTAIKLNITESSTPNTASFLFDLQRGGVSQFSVRRDGRATCQSLNVIGDISINGSAVTVSNFWIGLLNTGSLRASTTETRLDGGTHLGWSAGTNTNAADTRMWRDGAAGAIGLRDASTAHTLNIYNTYSSSTSYERLSIVCQSNDSVLIRTNKGSGGGSARALVLGTDGTNALTLTTAQKAEFAATIKTAAPTGGTAAEWKLGTVASVSPTSPNRTIEVEIGGQTYYVHAKTSND